MRYSQYHGIKLWSFSIIIIVILAEDIYVLPFVISGDQNDVNFITTCTTVLYIHTVLVCRLVATINYIDHTESAVIW